MKYILSNYVFGRVTVNGEIHTKDLIVCEDGIVANWRRREGHSLVPEDIAPYLPPHTRTLIVGCGKPGMLVVPKETTAWCNERRIDVIALPTEAACRRFNDFDGAGGVVAGLHLTC